MGSILSPRIVNTAPFSGPELAAEIRRLSDEVSAFYDSFEVDALFTCQAPGKWSPAGHLRHLTKANRAITRGLRVPKMLLLARFGPAFRASRTFDCLVDDYLAVVGAGAGPFAPSSGDPLVEREDYRTRMFGQWREVQEGLQAAIGDWSEQQLDRHRLPHPLLGKLTVRELLMFAAYHIVHHIRIVEERAAGRVPPVGSG